MFIQSCSLPQMKPSSHLSNAGNLRTVTGQKHYLPFLNVCARASYCLTEAPRYFLFVSKVLYIESVMTRHGGVRDDQETT